MVVRSSDSRERGVRVSEEILAKVRKLLAKAEDVAATPAEAETYTAKAAELIATYGIDRALLAEQDPDSDVVGDRVVVLDPPYALDKAGLLAGVAAQLRCRSVQRVRYLGDGREISLHLFGYASDLLRAEVLYTSLLFQATTALAHARPPFGESVAAFRRSWLAGFTAAITRRLADAETRARQEAEEQRHAAGGDAGRSVSLVLADRSLDVARAMTEAYPHTRRAQRRQLSGSGGRSGWLAGQRADLGGTARVGGGDGGRVGRSLPG
jgi:hypothetical protein